MTYNRVYLITYWTFCFRKECSVMSQTFVATLEIKFQRSKAIYTQALDEHSVTHTLTTQSGTDNIFIHQKPSEHLK